jgi:hypothetical protein
MISIIIQIQASITGKANNLGEYEKNAREKQKDTNIQDKHTPPSNQAIRMANTNPPPPPQSSKARSIKGFGKNIGQLSLYINISHLYVSLLNMRGSPSKITPKSLMVCTIHRIWEQQLSTVTYSVSVVD